MYATFFAATTHNEAIKMTDELQGEVESNGITLDSDPIENEEIVEETAQTTTEESGADLAPASGDDQNKNDDGVQKAINKQHAKYREEERKRIEIEKKLEEANKRLETIEAEKAKVEVPDLPDVYDEDYEAQLAAREEAIKRQAVQEAQQNVLLEQQKAQKEAAEKAEQDRFNGIIEGYSNRIPVLGLNPEEVRIAGEKVVEYGISSELAEHILKQEDGPLLTTYLSKNPIEMDELRHMSLIDAAMKVNSDIRNAASANKPQASQAPDPAETLSGRGAGEKVSPFIANATFD